MDRAGVEAVVLNELAEATGTTADQWTGWSRETLTVISDRLALDSLPFIEADWRVERALNLPSDSLPHDFTGWTLAGLVDWYHSRSLRAPPKT